MNAPDLLEQAAQRERIALLDTLETAFIAMGQAGANADLSHPCRKAWEAVRQTLKDAGRLP